MIHVKVGEEEIDFTIHKGLLCYFSAYFDRALNGSFKEAQEKVIYLRDESPEIIKLFNLWLYTQDIRDYGQSSEDVPLNYLVRLYLFGQCRQIPKLQNDAINLIVKVNWNDMKGENLEDQIDLIYSHTSSGSILRKLWVDLYLENEWVDNTLSTFKGNLHNHNLPATIEFLVELVVAQYDFIEKGCIHLPVSATDGSSYHIPIDKKSST